MTCRNCGNEITQSHPYPDHMPKEWTHAGGGAWFCPGSTVQHAEPTN